jgi:hypothetical protein
MTTGPMSRFSTTGEFRRLREADNLEDTLPNLRLEDTDAQQAPGAAPVKSRRGGHGVNPYDTFPQVGKSGLHDRNAELRKLSAWIRQRRMAEELKARRDKGEEED